MLALNLSELKVGKNTKNHIWNRHRLHKKQVMEALSHGILDTIEVDNGRIAIITKLYFILIIDGDNNLVTAFQGSERRYKQYLKKYTK